MGASLLAVAKSIYYFSGAKEIAKKKWTRKRKLYLKDYALGRSANKVTHASPGCFTEDEIVDW